MTFASEIVRQACDELNKRELPLQERLRATAHLFARLDARDFPDDVLSKEFRTINEILSGLRGHPETPTSSLDEQSAKDLARRIFDLSLELENRGQ